jgi:hypothetical protein
MNDVFNKCSRSQVVLSVVAGSGPKHGKISINADKTFTYTPNKNSFGIDSLTYSIKCGTDTHNAKIYLAVLKPLSLAYVACEDAEISFGMTAIKDVGYYLFDVPVNDPNDIAIMELVDVLTIHKDPSDVELWYIEPRYKGKTFPRITISITKSTDCGNENPVGCAMNGQLLFREDFGGNKPSDPIISTTPLSAGVTTYSFQSTDKLHANQYTLVKKIVTDASYEWQKDFSDHTYPNDKNRGYMFLVDASNDKGKFYETKITGLCDNINKLYFSVWVANVIPTYNTTAVDDPILRFELLDDSDNIIGTYVTSQVPRDADRNVKWRNYGFTFDPKKYGSLKLRIYNNVSGTNGNDFVLDDIEIRLCVPPVSMTASADTVCAASAYTLNGLYTDDGTYTSLGNTLVYQWQHSLVNDPKATWTTVNEGSTKSTSLNTTFKIDEVDAIHQGYYRLVVANSATVDYINCRAVSKSVYLSVKTMEANGDVAMTNYNHSTNIDVLKNDNLACFVDLTKLTLDTVAGSGLRNGSLTINPDKTLTYIPKNNISGIDSVDYTVSYRSIVKRARVYIIISKPLSLYNVACPGTQITIGMNPVPKVNYHWYSVPTGGNSLFSANQITITKDNSDVQTWYVEARYGTHISPRYSISVIKSDNCGNDNPTGCTVEGQLLFREDFGGNKISDPRVCSTALPSGVTGYSFMTTDRLNPNNYALVKHIDPGTDYAWHKGFSDHTNPNDRNRGYMFLVDASNTPGKFYETRITGLCDNIDRLYFSAWVINVLPTSNTAATDNPMLRFELLDDSDNIIGTYVTSSIPRDADNKMKWKNYGFMFDPKGYSSLKLVIYNNAQGIYGNDFAMDDIEIRLCVPPITIDGKLNDTVCTNTPVTFKASYEDINGTFTSSGKKLIYRWEYSVDGSSWSVNKEDSTSLSSIQSVYKIDSATEIDNGYYRLIVGNLGTIDNPLCRVVSKVISLNVVTRNVAPDFRAMINPTTTSHTVYLSSFIDTANVSSIKWNSLGAGITFINDETGALDAQKLMPKRVYTCRYTVTSKCGVSSAKAYIFTSTDKIRIRNGREIFVCKDLNLSRYVNLNQILGVESNGTWSYPNDTDGVVRSNIGASSTKFGGSMIFNAQRAYYEGIQSSSYNVAGDPSKQAFQFRYTTANGTTFDFTLIVGGR